MHDAPLDPAALGRRLVQDPALAAWLAGVAGGRPVRAQTVATLWRGYGAILRVWLTDGPMPTVVVKWVTPPARPAPSDGAAVLSHQRKVRSYEVEQHFYEHVLPQPATTHRTAACLGVARDAEGFRTALEDLGAAGFRTHQRHVDDAALRRCLDWLASFHARFLHAEPPGLWPVGSYWHLGTRRQELAAMQDAELRAAAERLDALLTGSRHRTLVHGDPKTDNFCFGRDGVAALDFQYVGGGPGVRDVAYLLGSCRSDDECEASAAGHLDHYFAALERQLRGAPVDADDVIACWRALYPAAWADLARFLDGWAPGRWPVHRYTRRMLREALASP